MSWLNTNYILRAGVLSVLLLLPGLMSATEREQSHISGILYFGMSRDNPFPVSAETVNPIIVAGMFGVLRCGRQHGVRFDNGE